jgi:hypothetical protein
MNVGDIKGAAVGARDSMLEYQEATVSLHQKAVQTRELYAGVADLAAKLALALAEVERETTELALMSSEAKKEDLRPARRRLISAGLHDTEDPNVQSALGTITELLNKNTLLNVTLTSLGEKALEIAGIDSTAAGLGEEFQRKVNLTSELQTGAGQAVNKLDAFLQTFHE